MQKRLYALLLVVITLFVLPGASAQNNGDYRSGTGLWSNPSSWQKYNGVKWVPAVTAPNFNDGPITVSEGHTITVNTQETADQTLVATGGTLVINPFGTLRINNGIGADLTMNGTLSNAGTIDAADNSALTNNGSITNFGNANFKMGINSSLANAGYLENKLNGEIRIETDGDLNNHLYMVNFGYIVLNNANLNNNWIFQNKHGSRLKVDGTLLDDGNLTNNAAGSFNNEGEIIIDDNSELTNRGGMSNRGTIHVTSNGGIRSLFTNELSGSVSNDGVILIEKKCTLIQKGNTFNNNPDGTISVSSGSFLWNTENSSFINTGAITINYGSTLDNIYGTFDNSGGNITVALADGGQQSKLINHALGNFNNSGTIAINDNSLLQNAHNFTNRGGTITVEASTLDNLSNLDNKAGAEIIVDGAGGPGSFLNNKPTGTLTNEGTITLKNKGFLTNEKDVKNLGSGKVYVTGPLGSFLINKSAGTIINEGEVTIDAASELDDKGAFNNKGNGILNIKSTGKVNFNGSAATNEAVVNLEGEITGNGIVNNTGTLASLGGKLTGSGTFRNSGTIKSAGITNFDGFSLLNTGLINGSGTLNFNSPDLLINNGRIAPGDVGTIGTLTILGANPFSNNSTLLIDAGPGPSHDLLVSNVSLALAGQLQVSKTNPLQPPYTILQTSGSLTGTLGYTPPDPSLQIRYGVNEVLLSSQVSPSCSAPANLSAANFTGTSAGLSWSAVGGALGYTLEWKPVAAATWQSITGLTSTLFALTGLTPGTDYEFRVSARCGDGNSAPSTAFGFSTLCSEPRFLGIPLVITATNAELHWTSNPTDLGYTFRWKLAGTGPWSPEIHLTAPTYTLTGLSPGTGYAFQVSATCGNGSTSGYFTENQFSTTCGTPAGLAASVLSNSTANLSWGAVPGALRYTLQWKPASGSTWTTIPAIATPSFTLTGLAGATAYTFQVNTICTSATSGYSVPFAFTTLPAFTYWRDADGDKFGNINRKLDTSAATPPPGYTTNGLDCNDNDATVYPGAPELCDGKDNDCDGQTDEGVMVTCYQDKDGDGFGSSKKKTVASCNPPVGYVLQSGDCDDSDYTIHPGAAEVCDGKDNDCDGQVDEGFNKTFYRDVDGDGYGGKTKITTCNPPAGYVAQGGDCDDNDPGVHPGGVEICFNGKDDNCNGQQDEGCIKPGLTISDASVYEAQGSIAVPVNLSAGVPWTVSVKYKTKKGTAKSPNDYTEMDGTLVIAAGLTSGQINIPVVPDNLTEGDEYFFVELSKPVNAEILDDAAIITIRDGVPPVALSKKANSNMITKAEEGNSGLSLTAFPNPSSNSFTLVAKGSPDKPVEVRIVDRLGRLTETRRIKPNSSYTIGQNYRPGIYFVEAVQGNKKETIKLVKQ